ncbi:hypothetical protein GW765_01860 [Candidatus Parcubacteria bacterium]|nr:hypothetical protein [Candidatus Parcubacteria bacterium]
MKYLSLLTLALIMFIPMSQVEATITADAEASADVSLDATPTLYEVTSHSDVDDDDDDMMEDDDDMMDDDDSYKGMKDNDDYMMEDNDDNDSYKDKDNDDESEDDRKEKFMVRAKEVRGWAENEKEDFLSEIKAHAEVKSEQELNNFAKGILIKDENVENVSFDQDKVRLEYKARGNFLGFIPVKYNQEISVNHQEDGEEKVEVKSPWYKFLIKKEISAKATKSSIEESISAIQKDLSASFDYYANLLEKISISLKTMNETSVEVEN